MEDTSSSESDEDLRGVLPEKKEQNGRPPIVPKKSKGTLRFDEVTSTKRDENEDDFMIDDDIDNNENSEQYDKMKELEDKRNKSSKNPKRDGLQSAYTSKRGGPGGLSSATTRIVDLTDDQISYGIRPSTAIQLNQIQALTEFNKSLKKKEKNLAQPMFGTTNVGYNYVIKRDLKKKTIELITRYNPIGFIDDHFKTSEDDASSTQKYSMNVKVRSLSRESSRKRIDQIRLHSGSLINASKSVHQNDRDNVFNNNNPDQFNGPITMSLYNQAHKMRPLTAPTEGPQKNNWLKKYEKLQPVPEEGAEVEVKDTRLPEFKPPAMLRIPTRADIEGYRQEEL